MTKNKKRIAFIAILFCIVMMCSACSATNTDKVNEQAIANEQAALNEQIVKICEDYGLGNITVELSRYKDYNQYLLNVVSMDKHTADCLKSWLAG